MDISDLPQWFFDIQTAARSMKFGRINFELVVANGEISKVIGNKVNQVRFHGHEQDQKAAKLWALDELNTMEGNGTKTFSVVHKGQITNQINTFDTIEYNYAPGTKQ